MATPKYDFVVIGGGFYGCMVALFLSRFSKKVLILEAEDDLLTRASYNNQARIHNGYHYPRSFLTALRSHANFRKFNRDFKAAVDDKFSMVYAIASASSKTTAGQFLKFCRQIGSKVAPAPTHIKKLFDPFLIEDVFAVEEFIFNAVVLRRTFKKLLHQSKIRVKYRTQVEKICQDQDDQLALILANGRTIVAKNVFNCTYSGINTLLQNSTLPLLPLKHEWAEMALIKVPSELQNLGITIMDGQFFGVLPFPDKKLHTLHHVRYTPRYSWSQDPELNLPNKLKAGKFKTNFPYMIRDAQRYIPVLKNALYKGSLFDTKTVLMQNEESDGRPILFRKNYGLKNLHIIMGGKIDNIYDILAELKKGL